MIGEVKITPVKNGKYQQHIQNIKKDLDALKEHTFIADDVTTI